jgi:hypothetical protein
MSDIFEKYTEAELYEVLASIDPNPYRYWMGIVYYVEYRVPENVSELEPGVWTIVRNGRDHIVDIIEPYTG